MSNPVTLSSFYPNDRKVLIAAYRGGFAYAYYTSHGEKNYLCGISDKELKVPMAPCLLRLCDISADIDAARYVG